jgi:hypothetical protein
MDLNRFYEIFPPGYTFTISNAPKRDEGEWWDRWTWQLSPSSNIGGKIHESKWFGFQTMEEALNNLNTYLENYRDYFQVEGEDEPEDEIDFGIILDELYKYRPKES